MGKVAGERARTARLFRAFRESEPRHAAKVWIRPPRTLIYQGKVELIAYRTKHGRWRVVPYAHEFAPGSQPILAAGPDPGQLYLVGKRYRVTGRGIVDIDARGRPRHHRPRYIVLPRALLRYFPPHIRRRLDRGR